MVKTFFFIFKPKTPIDSMQHTPSPSTGSPVTTITVKSFEHQGHYDGDHYTKIGTETGEIIYIKSPRRPPVQKNTVLDLEKSPSDELFNTCPVYEIKG